VHGILTVQTLFTLYNLHLGTEGLWSFGVLGPWDLGMFGYWDVGMLGYWAGTNSFMRFSFILAARK